jgi:tetratricopeptide (TPR) repeat protein
MTRSLVSVLVLLASSSSLFAQAELARDNCDLSVRVLASDERNIEAQLQVQLLSSQGVLASVQTQGGDSAQFRVTNGRTYRLTVSGTGIETVTTPYFKIEALEQTHVEIVHVKAANQKPAAESTPGSPTISVSEMNIPRKASVEMNKGLDAYAKGDMDKAAAHFERAITEYPRYARAYEMLGVIAIKRSNRVKAREFFSKALQMDATFCPAYVDLARMNLQDQNYAESESLLAKAMAVNPSMPDALALLATTEFANKEYDKALADVQRTHALRNHEPFAEVHIMAGKVLRMQNHPEEAIAQFQLFLQEKPDSPEGESVRAAIASLQAGQRQ